MLGLRRRALGGAPVPSQYQQQLKLQQQLYQDPSSTLPSSPSTSCFVSSSLLRASQHLQSQNLEMVVEVAVEEAMVDKSPCTWRIVKLIYCCTRMSGGPGRKNQRCDAPPVRQRQLLVLF